MKQQIKVITVFFTLLCLMWGCQEDESHQPQEIELQAHQSKKERLIAHLQNKLGEASSIQLDVPSILHDQGGDMQIANTNEPEPISITLDYSQIQMIENNAQQTSYGIKAISNSGENDRFYTYISRETNGEYSHYILEMVVDLAHYQQTGESIDWTSFYGKMNIYSESGEQIGGSDAGLQTGAMGIALSDPCSGDGGGDTGGGGGGGGGDDGTGSPPGPPSGGGDFGDDDGGSGGGDITDCTFEIVEDCWLEGCSYTVIVNCGGETPRSNSVVDPCIDDDCIDENGDPCADPIPVPDIGDYLDCMAPDGMQSWECCHLLPNGCNDEDETIIDCIENGDCHEVFCDEIEEQITDSDFIAKADELKNSFDLEHEVGYAENLQGEFTALTVSNDGHSMSFGGVSAADVKGYMHTHINNITETLPNGTIKTTKTIKMHSPQDILFFLQLVLTQNTVGTAKHEIYGSMYSSEGNYTIKFGGDVDDIGTNLEILAQDKKLDKKYKKIFRKKENTLEKAFLKFIDEQLEIDGIDLYKINDDGTVEQKILNNEGEVESLPCE